MGSYQVTNEFGTQLDLSTLTPDQRRAVSEVTTKRTPGGLTRTKIKLHDKIAALVTIGKHLGMFKGTIRDTGVHYVITDQPMDEDTWKATYGNQNRLS